MFRTPRALLIRITPWVLASVESRYRRLNQREHVLKRPDMYVGTVHPVPTHWWLYNIDAKRMEHKKVTYVPAFYKIFDEIIVNAADNKVRQQEKQTVVRVTVDPTTGWISVMNDGDGIPVKMHKEYKLWVPQLIFGSLLTSSNYNDSEKRVTGGCYGYGAKLTNIFSDAFTVETYDPKSDRKFLMKWSKNMESHEEPQIEKDVFKKTLAERRPNGFTTISFLPDYKLLNMEEGLTNDALRMLHRRVIDLSGIIGSSTKIYYNGQPVGINSFEEYAQLYPIDLQNIVRQKEKRWEITAGVSKGDFLPLSFVNSTFTVNNGTHMKYVLDEITAAVRDAAVKQDSALKIKAETIKNRLFLFVNCQIENPQFDSQQKLELRSRPSSFGSYPSAKALAAKLVRDTNIVALVIAEATSRDIKRVTTVRRQGMLCIPKLDDAAKAGTKDSAKCTLIITEGDSAKALAISGLSVVGRDYYGVFPVRGKPMNIRNLSKLQISKCEEVMNILRILGISLEDQEVERLRYGKIMIMADQDVDGVHIKGLLCNIIEVIAPHLYRRGDFLSQFITPLVKITGPGQLCKSFYSMNECRVFLSAQSPQVRKQLRAKYYKGLGTSTSKEAREYFSNIKDNTIDFVYDPKSDVDCLEIPFNKSNAALRRDWILKREATGIEDFDFKKKSISYTEFVNKQLIEFSLSDCLRTLPHFVDGFKTTQRKVLHGALKRDLTSSIKVQELAGYISEHCGYYHGDQSLIGTIIRMAQDFVGSNNVPLLYPEGQFGTRMLNGADCAAARYIFTKLFRVTKLIFREEDMENLEQLQSEGKKVEPAFFVPVVPMLLVNGNKGIATGFNTCTLPRNIRELIGAIRRRLDGDTSWRKLNPNYEGFLGEVVSEKVGTQTVGMWDLVSATCICIRDIPVGSSIQEIKNHLTTLYESGIITSYQEHHTAELIDFDVHCHPQIIAALVRTNMVAPFFKLVSAASHESLTVIENNRIRTFGSIREVFQKFFDVRMHFYTLRKNSLMNRLKNNYIVQTNRHKFMEAMLTKKLALPDDPVAIPELMRKHKLVPHPADESYSYLVDQKISTMTRANLVALSKKTKSISEAIKTLEKLSEKDLWRKDLDALEVELDRQDAKRSKHSSRPPTVSNGTPISQDTLDFVRKFIIKNASKI